MVKIYGTLGPACADATTLEKMFKAGMTGVRLNLAHSTLTGSEEWIDELKKAARHLGIKPDLLIDMQGPEIRVGWLDKPMTLKEGSEVYLSVQQNNSEKGMDSASRKSDNTAEELKAAVTDESCIPVPAMVMPYLDPGKQVLLDDGKLLLKITEREKDACGTERVKAFIIRGGSLQSRKSIAIPGADLYPPTMTENDMTHIHMAGEYGVTGIMQPFVRNRDDLAAVRRALDESGGGDIRIFAKIENMDGVRHLSELMPAADEFVIARGDLGNSMPLWDLPAVQKLIARQCKSAGKPFMVVTQMLASMETAAVPTRAEVSDVFNAVLDGAASVMVTAETAVGAYPVEVIKYLVNTVRSAQKYMEKSN